MKPLYKSDAEIEKMRVSGHMSAQVLSALAAAVAPGMTTGDLDTLARKLIKDIGGVPSFLGYFGYPGALCVSLNEVVIHGIPGSRVIRSGDIVSLDIGVLHDGFHGDNALTVAVGEVDGESRRLLDLTRRALDAGIAAARPGARLSDVSHAIQTVADEGNLGIVREYVGHGIGRSMHEEPQVPNYGPAGKGPLLKAGLVFCIEPMLNLGGAAVRVLDDGWTVVTRDRSRSAHFERMIAIREDRTEILTPW
ncbi:MAG: type I methionyl aminopeptidase [Kiritimatiellia bacterium]